MYVRIDSQSKRLPVLLTRRAAVLALVFLLGATLGIVAAQRMYVEANRAAADIPRPPATVCMLACAPRLLALCAVHWALL